MSENSTITPTRVPRGRRILLILSLCLNVTLIVMIVVALGIGFRQGLRHMPFSPRQLQAQATRGERDAIQAVIAAHEERTKLLTKASRDAHWHALDVFEAPNFSKADMQAAFDQMHAADDALRAETTSASIDAMAELSAGERKTLGDKLRRRAHWWGLDKHRP